MLNYHTIVQTDDQDASRVGAMTEWDWFVGRQAELTEILQTARRVRRGEPWGVLVEGEAGIGKASLIRRALAELTDFTVLHAVCDPGRSGSDLGVIGQLWRATDAIAHGFAPAPGPPGGNADRELLGSVTRLCTSGPVAVVLEDAQWADSLSARALSSLLHRLDGGSVLTIATVRSGCFRVSRPGASADDWRRAFLGRAWSRHLLLAGLTASEVAGLTERYWPGGLDQAASQWLHHYTGGIPALLTALLPGLAADGSWAPGVPPRLPGTTVAVVSGMLASLPQTSRALLAAMAVLDDRMPLALVASVAGVRHARAALEPLIEKGLAGWDPAEFLSPVSIQHPIYRDAIYRLLPSARRRALHAAAARHVSGIAVWRHRVAAAGLPNAILALALEKEAERYCQAGKAEPAGMLLLWSSGASADRADRERRLLLAVEQLLFCGKMNLITEVQPHLEACPPSAARNLALGLLAGRSGRYSRALTLLSEARRLAGTGDLGHELGIYVDLALAALHAEQGDAETERQAASRLLAAPGLPEPVRQQAQVFLVDAAGHAEGGPAAALRLLQDTVAVPSDPAELASGGGLLLWARGKWRALAGQLTAAAGDLSLLLRSADEVTMTSTRPLAQAYLAFTQFRLGQWQAAAVTAGQAVVSAGPATPAWLQVPAHSVAACIAAVRGEWQQARYHARTAQHSHDRAGRDTFAAFPAVAAAMIAGARADYPAMLAAFTAVLRRPGPVGYQQAWWGPLYVEALVGRGELSAAREALAELKAFAAASGQLGTALAWLDAWLTASTGDRAGAAARFAEAACRPAPPDDIPFHRARLAHEYGRLLSSLRQRKTAIRWLYEARTWYTMLGAQPYLDRCDADLLGCGVRRGTQEPSADGGDGQPLAVLTARERRIVYLVASGLTNQEVGSELYVSAKTVEYHLGNIFAKLGITSRRQLRSLADGAGKPAADAGPGAGGQRTGSLRRRRSVLTVNVMRQ